MDLFTTAIKLAGGKVPADRPIDGYDISPALFGSGPSPRREFFYFDSPYDCRTQICAVRSESWKLHFRKVKVGEAAGLEPTELYHLDRDPGESVNRIREEPELVARLTERARA